MKSKKPPTRRASRFQAGLPAVLHAGGRDLPCQARDLSRSGVLVIGELPEVSDAEVRLTLDSLRGDLRLSVRARVMRKGTQDDLQTLGLEILDLDPKSAETLEALVARAVEGLTLGPLEALPDNATPAQQREAVERVPLAHRLALATRALPREREILLQDPNPAVLDALSRNPNLNPVDVRALLRVRNLLPRTLQTLANDGRWTSNETLKILIAAHPATPLLVAERLAGSLSPAGLRRLVQTPGVDPTLRMKLGRSLR